MRLCDNIFFSIVAFSSYEEINITISFFFTILSSYTDYRKIFDKKNMKIVNNECELQSFEFAELFKASERISDKI